MKKNKTLIIICLAFIASTLTIGVAKFAVLFYSLSKDSAPLTYGFESAPDIEKDLITNLTDEDIMFDRGWIQGYEGESFKESCIDIGENDDAWGERVWSDWTNPNLKREFSTEKIDYIVAIKAEAANQRALIALKTNYRLAMEHAERASLLVPDEGRYSELAGLMASSLGEWDKAIDYLEQALKSYCGRGHSASAAATRATLKNISIFGDTSTFIKYN